jgi:hypothetical protein
MDDLRLGDRHVDVEKELPCRLDRSFILPDVVEDAQKRDLGFSGKRNSVLRGQQVDGSSLRFALVEEMLPSVSPFLRKTRHSSGKAK